MVSFNELTKIYEEAKESGPEPSLTCRPSYCRFCNADVSSLYLDEYAEHVLACLAKEQERNNPVVGLSA